MDKIPLCTAPACLRPATRKCGYCESHYRLQIRHGSINYRRTYPRTSIAERFWRKVDRRSSNECWRYQGTIRPNGYGKFSIDSSRVKPRTWSFAHRLAWELTYGDIPDGLLVCHTCDNRACCNPVHLFLGTNLDNMQDAVAKGRVRHSERHGMARLTDIQVLEIRLRYGQGGISQRQLAREYGVCVQTICNIVNNKWWQKVG